MRLSGKSILLISPEPWNHIFVSKHHYAIHLSALGNNVFFLDPPGTREQISETSFANLRVVDYTGFSRGLRLFPRFLRKFITREKFDGLARLCHTHFDIVWSFDNSVFFEFSALPATVRKISHIVDLNQNFETATAASSADICFCTTTQIRNRLLKYNRRVFKIHHGFNDVGSHVLVTLPGKSAIKALYAGNLGMPYIDWVVLRSIVNEHPEVDFVFLGPNAEHMSADVTNNMAKSEVVKKDNVYFPGPKPADELMSYYAAADVLVVCYQEKHHLDQANPHKMMEYLGSGKVIVSSFTAEFIEQRDLIAMASNNNEYKNVFSSVVRDLPFQNRPDIVARRKAFASAHTYNEQIKKIETILMSEIGIDSTHNQNLL